MRTLTTELAYYCSNNRGVCTRCKITYYGFVLNHAAAHFFFFFLTLLDLPASGQAVLTGVEVISGVLVRLTTRKRLTNSLPKLSFL